jgi:hypothetical protein
MNIVRTCFVSSLVFGASITSHPLSAQDYLGQCGIPSNMNSPTCMDRRSDPRTYDRSPETYTPRSYGALAYNEHARKAGSSHNLSSQEKAETAAEDDCNDKSNGIAGCRSRFYFYDTCAAIAAYKGEELVGFSHNENLKVAEAKAKAVCSQYYQATCEVVESLCSR